MALERALAVTTIAKDALLVTFINVFTVDPSNQRRLVELLFGATETSVRHVESWAPSPE